MDWALKSVSLAVVICGLSPAARAEVHWTTNGIHKGVVSVCTSPGGAVGLDSSDVVGGRNFIGCFTLSYALWTLGGEPLHDYIFTWDWRTEGLVVAQGEGYTITAQTLGKYADLSNTFFALKPVSITLTTRVEFFDAGAYRLAVGSKTVMPGNVEQAGVKDPLHLPGSPRWADYFLCEFPDKPPRDEMSLRNKELFLKAARVKLREPKIVGIKWPEAAIKSLVDEALRREGIEIKPPPVRVEAKPATEISIKPAPVEPALNLAKELPADPALAAALTAPSASAAITVPAAKPAVPAPNPLEPAARAPTNTASLNPLELARLRLRAGPENPLERSARLEAEAQTRSNAVQASENLSR